MTLYKKKKSQTLATVDTMLRENLDTDRLGSEK
jgi:hypothetical protein